ncbi:MAG: trimethylamine methyltransferase family protein [Desulfobacterales bacterium]|jgi:trimethylamine--corrinoid protein Co-methyltransferase
MMFDRMGTLSEEELNRLHSATMEILRDVGISFGEPDALKIFKNHGVKVDGDKVFLTEDQITNALDTVPAQFSVAARDPEKSVVLGGDNLVFTPGYGTVFITSETGDLRRPVMEDHNNLCKLVQTSKYIDVNGCLMVDPSDVPAETAHLDMLFSNLVLCDKPFLSSSASRQAVRECIELAGIGWGGADKIKDKPVMISVITPLSPLQYSWEMAGALIENSRYGQVSLIGLLMMAGSTGPVTLSGLMALQNAEILAAVVLTQLVNPGAPVIYGGTSTITDMRTGSLASGAPEMPMIQHMQVQMARFYDIPCRGTGGITDAHVPDIQAGIESALALSTTIRSGANFILHACGILSSFLAMSYEKFIIDEELCGMLRRMIKPVDISDESIDLATIKEIGIGGEYLTHARTYERCRTEFFLPTLMNRQDYESWNLSGKKTLDETATERVAGRLAAYEKPKIDPAIEQELSQYVAKRKNI